MNNKKWTTVIKPKNGWFDIDLKELWSYRDLIFLFVKRDFVTYYKQTILGPAWFVIQALFTAGLFTVIFGKVANISTNGIPQILFYLAGIVNWQYFSDSLLGISKTFIDNKQIISKVYFPRLTIPFSVVISNMIQYSIKFTLFLGFFFYYYFIEGNLDLSVNMLFTPLLLLQMAFLALGIGVWISALASKYRDLAFAIPFLTQLAMYITPIVYPISIVPEKYQLLYSLNPMAFIVEAFRYCYFGVGSITMQMGLISTVITLFLFISGIVVFSRIEKSVMDTV